MACTQTATENPMLTGFVPPTLLGVSLWVFAFFLGGLGVAGQPQVVSRVMTLGSDKERKQAMVWFFVWQTPFIALMLVIGWASRVVFTQDGLTLAWAADPRHGSAWPLLGRAHLGLHLRCNHVHGRQPGARVHGRDRRHPSGVEPGPQHDEEGHLGDAMFATVISSAAFTFRAETPCSHSCWPYGLGGIFVPMLIIRWAGYQPDTRHSVTMMIAALVGVIVWRLLGLNEHVFESIPGMGMAFLAHFIDHAYRVRDGSPLGRYEMPWTSHRYRRPGHPRPSRRGRGRTSYATRPMRPVLQHRGPSKAPLNSLKSDWRGIRRGRTDGPR